MITLQSCCVWHLFKSSAIFSVKEVQEVGKGVITPPIRECKKCGRIWLMLYVTYTNPVGS